MTVEALPFPDASPQGYEPLGDEPAFDARRHFDFVPPERTVTLAELGYGADVISASPSPVAFAGPFRVLSDEGIAITRAIARRLEPQARISSRTARYLSGGMYRSRFLRDAIRSPELAQFLSSIAQTPLAAHSMPAMSLYVNYAPADINRHVDQWHADSVGFDIVLLVSDPTTMKGGAFQVFKGTTDEAARLFGTNAEGLIEGGRIELPEERVESFVPRAGWAIFQQGNLVVHRAMRLLEPGERISIVPGFVALDRTKADPTNIGSIVHWGEPGMFAEIARHEAWLTEGRLQALIRELPIDADPAKAAAALRGAVADLLHAADLLDQKA
jgi:hypothetical protein